MRLAKADLVPTEANLLERYATFADLQAACEALCARGEFRPHRMTGRLPVEMLAEERSRLYRLPAAPVTVAFGQTRRVGWDCTISIEGTRYSCRTSTSTSGSGSAGPGGARRHRR